MYGTFKKDDRKEDEFPWFMFSLFMLILTFYGLVMYGSWEVAQQLEIFAVRSNNVMEIMGRTSSSVGDAVGRSVEENSAKMSSGLGLLREEMSLAVQETGKLKGALSDEKPDGMAEYVRAQKILFAQAERVSIIRAGLKSYGFEQQPEEFVNLLSNILFVLTPLAELVPRHQVAARSLHSSMRSITLIQQGFAKIESVLSSMGHSEKELETYCLGFIENVSIMDDASLVGSYRDMARKNAGSLESDLGSLSNISTFLSSEYMEKLLQLDLVKDLKTMVAKERTALVAKVDQAHEASKDLALASSEAAGAFEMAVGGLKLMAGDLKEELGSLERYVLATGLLMNHLVRDLARFYKTTVMACLAVACAMAFLAFFYACYLENVYENEGVARAFDTEPKERQGCCWKCVTCIGSAFRLTGFYALMLLQDAVSLILVFLTLMMGTISLAQIGVASGCQSAEILSDDAACVKELGELGNFVDADLLQQRSCHDAGLLICESMMANVAMVSHTLLLAVLGTILSCCIPRRLLVVWMSTQHNVAMAEVLADSDRGGKPMDYSAYSVP